MLPHKTLKLFLNYFLGPILFAFITFSIYKQVFEKPQLGLHWNHVKKVIFEQERGYIIIAFLLMFLNWGLESRKWQILTSHVHKTKFSTAVKSVMAGVSLTMLTPNRMGEFLGRVLYLPDGSRIRGAALMFLSSISQLAITLIFGIAGVVFLSKIVNEVTANNAGYTHLFTSTILFGSTIVLIIGILLYFNIGWLIRQVEKLPPFSKYASYVHVIGEIHHLELLKLISLSLFRYIIFLCQYLLIFNYFEVGISLAPLVASTSVLFLLLAIIPTIALAELGVRGQVSLFIYGMFSQNTLEILIATAIIWIINIIFPALVGSFMLLTVKVFRKP